MVTGKVMRGMTKNGAMATIWASGTGKRLNTEKPLESAVLTVVNEFEEHRHH